MAPASSLTEQRDEFTEQMQLITAQMRMAITTSDVVELDKLERTLQRAVDFGCFVLPTEWINGGRARAEQSLKAVRAFRAFVVAAREAAAGGGE